MHFRARSYDARVGRFTQQEPRKVEAIEGHYSYARGNPLRFSDPSGRVIVEIGTNAFIPEEWVKNPDFTTGGSLGGDNREIGQRPAGKRAGSSRIETFIYVELDQEKGPVYVWKEWLLGKSRLRKWNAVYNGHFVLADHGAGEANQDAKRNRSVFSRNQWDTVEVTISVTAGLPPKFAAGAPSIDYELRIELEQRENPNTGDLYASYKITGSHDGFPNYEVWIGGNVVYGYDHRTAALAKPVVKDKSVIHYGDQSPLALYPPMDINVKTQGSVDIPEK